MGTDEKNGRAGGNSLRQPTSGYTAVAKGETQKPEEEGCGFFCLQPRWMRPLANR